VAEEALLRRIVPAIALAGHGLYEIRAAQLLDEGLTGVVAALITVDDGRVVQLRPVPGTHVVYHVQHEVHPEAVAELVGYSDVTAWFVETVKQYDLFPAWVYYDSYSARYFVEEMQMQGFNMVRCIQGAKTLSLPMQMLGADLQAHKVIYNNNPVLKWCLTNTGIQTNRNGNIVPIKNQSPKQRIDGTAALLDCYVGLYEHYNEYTTAI
jgi:hypothetical protein